MQYFIESKISMRRAMQIKAKIRNRDKKKFGEISLCMCVYVFQVAKVRRKQASSHVNVTFLSIYTYLLIIKHKFM